MTSSRPATSVSRRTALAGLGAGGLGLALAATARPAAAQDPASAREPHPQVGVWMVESPTGRAIAVYSDDGSVVTAVPASQARPQGVTFSSTQIGTWEPTGERGAHLTAVQLLSDGAGAYAGSVTVDAYQEVSQDGQTWRSGAGTTDTTDTTDRDDGPGCSRPVDGAISRVAGEETTRRTLVGLGELAPTCQGGPGAMRAAATPEATPAS